MENARANLKVARAKWGDSEVDYAEHRLILQFTHPEDEPGPGFGQAQLKKLRESIPDLEILRTSPLLKRNLVYSASTTAIEMARVLSGHPGVKYVAPDLLGDHQAITIDDPHFGSQWGLRQARVPNAWNITRGFNRVLIGLVDSGIAMNYDGSIPHPDTDERRMIMGHNYLDPINRPWDPFGHGTHMFGIIAATANNEEGIVGVNHVSPVYITSTGDSLADTLDAIEETVHFYTTTGRLVLTTGPFGATVYRFKKSFYRLVINLSKGWSTNSLAWPDLLQLLRLNHVPICCAMGNAPATVLYPAALSPAHDNVIAVGATIKDGSLAPYSARGNRVSIMAPGGGLDIDPSIPKDGIFSTWPYYVRPSGLAASASYPIYISKYGTSQATALVTGVVSLMLSRGTNASPRQIRNTLFRTATPMGGTRAPRPDSGFGLLNAQAAVNAIPYSYFPDFF